MTAHPFIKNVYNVFMSWPLPFLRCCRPSLQQRHSAARLPLPACRAQLPQALCKKGLQRPLHCTKARILNLTRGCGPCRGARLLFGDQTLFCRACDFRRAGGYASRLPIMEDADLCIRLHMAGPGRLSCPGNRSRCLLYCCGLWCCSRNKYIGLAGHLHCKCTPHCYRQLVCNMLDRNEAAGRFPGRQQMKEGVPGKEQHGRKFGSCAGAEAPHRGAKAVETATEGQQKEKQHLLPPWFWRRGKVIMVGPCCSCSSISPSLLGEEDPSSWTLLSQQRWCAFGRTAATAFNGCRRKPLPDATDCAVAW